MIEPKRLDRFPVREEARYFFATAKAPRLRTMRQFAEQEIVLPPNGPVVGKYRVSHQPIDGFLLDEIDSGRWNEIALTGCVQSGKTMKGVIIPTLYHLFEMKENVGFGIPTIDMAGIKWRDDLKPVIEASRYRSLLPRGGSGSRGGGKFTSITFRNGTTLQFLSSKGGDEVRSGFTTRVLVVTEVDKMDEASKASKETDPIRQMEARTKAFKSDRQRKYFECTVSYEEGRIWQKVTGASNSRFVSPCAHCGEYVTPELEHFVGWEEAPTAKAAGRLGAFHCPVCGETYDDDQRKQMIESVRLLHGSQEVNKDGEVTGEIPDTDALGVRYSAFHNKFWDNADIAKECWLAAHAKDGDEESAQKELQQFVAVKPYKPPRTDLTPLKADEIKGRTGIYPRGTIPSDARFLTMGVDVGKSYLHWTCIAWTPLRPYIVDYNVHDVASERYGEENAIPKALGELYERAMGLGWTQDQTGHRLHPAQIWVDSQHWTDTVKDFCRLHMDVCKPSHGRGESQYGTSHFGRKTTAGKTNQYEGEQFRIQANEVARIYEAIVDVDHWKSKLHRALATPLVEILDNGQPGEPNPGSIVLWGENKPNDHMRFAKHLTSEKKRQEFIHGRGVVTWWEHVSGANHWLDSTVLAYVSGHFCGWPFPTEAPRPVAPQVSRSGLRMPGDRPWVSRR